MDGQGEESLSEPLSQRELEILVLLKQGLSNREIAQELILSLETIKWYNKQIYSKLGVNSRTQAAAKADQIGLIEAISERDIESKPPARYFLPAELTSFIGRQRAISEVTRLLETGRLVTLTGPGGSGKTRLALKVGEQVAGRYTDGVNFVSLASINDHAMVPRAVAQELGLVEKPNVPVNEALERYLNKRHMLLIIDNYEHVLDAANLVTELLMAAPRLTIMATSREPLHLSSEFEYLVPPLELPRLERGQTKSVIMGIESTALFVQRAQAASSSFLLNNASIDSIVRICTLLDGLPLAIELAAARTKLFSPKQMLDRMGNLLQLTIGGLRDAPDRQRTLRNTIMWSTNLLNVGEQSLFSRLGAFSGGFSLGAAEAVCGQGLDVDTLDGVESLLDKSLLIQAEGAGGEPRFYMLETIHEFAREQLADSGEDAAIRARHLEYFVALIEEMEPGFRQRNQLILLEQTKVEMDNIRAAFNLALAIDRVGAAARLVSAADYYYRYRDLIVEGYRKIHRVLKRIEEVPMEFRGRLLLAAVRVYWVSGAKSEDEQFGRQALAIFEELGDAENRAWALLEIAGSLIGQPEHSKLAQNMNEEGLAIFRELNDLPGMAYGLNTLGEVARFAGNYQLARTAYEEALDICYETGEIYRQSMLQANLAFVAYDEKYYELAKDYATSILKQRLEIAWREWALIGLAVLAGPLSKLDQPEKAARLLAASASMLSMIGVDYQPGDQPEISKYLANVRSLLDDDKFESAWEEGQAMTFDQAVAYALSDSAE